MDSAIVIKVKYGDTLRRFNAHVNKEEIDFDMDGLRGKIISLFKFAPDSELTLTYIDEDGDVVTLVDNEDLRDVVQQALNPLRIMVSLNTDKHFKPSARSPYVQNTLQNMNSSVSELLKSIPEPLQELLSKMSSDLTSRTRSTAPNLADIIEKISKLGLPSLYQLSESQAGEESSNSVEAAQNLDGSKSNSDEVHTDTINSWLDIADSQGPGLETLVAASLPATTNINQPGGNAMRTMYCKPIGFRQDAGEEEQLKRPKVPDLNGKAVCYTNVAAPPVASNYIKDASGKGVGFTYAGAGPVSANKSQDASGKDVGFTNAGTPILAAHNIKDASKHSEIYPGGSTSSPGFLKWSSSSTQTVDFNAGIKTKSAGGSEFSTRPLFSPSSVNECPFTGMPIGDDMAIPQNSPLRRNYNDGDGIFHRGVCCDGCGLHPITGPRFKSNVKDDYDLCSICFAEIGNSTDYMRIDRPVIYRPFLYDQHARVRPSTLLQVSRGRGVKPGRPKLDSRFIQDVNILDGTIMAPATLFTKIWRMRNNGTIVWPLGTQLVWIGGDRLTDTLSVELGIVAAGLPMGQELDIAVNLVAPELPGRYISYWKMASPSGQKFGQRVWVLIQVDASIKVPMHDTIHGFNLNFPPASDIVRSPEIGSSNPEPMADNILFDHNTSNNVLVERIEPVADAPVNQESQFPITNSLLVGEGALNASASGPSSVSSPIIDLTEEDASAASTSAPPLLAVVEASDEEVEEKNNVEEKLLKELEEMGFKQVDLNKEILRMNQYDLEQSVDDLCGVSDWDPILEELQDMGFSDKETNMKLLKKNNGSIKRVVMDLLAGETM